MNIDWNNIDFDDPESFAHLLGPGLPIPDKVSPAEVKRQVNERRSSVLSSYESLHDILLRHEATIQKRWAKKTRAARTKILLDCWPKMAKPHRPDFAAFREEGAQLKAGRSYRTPHRDSYVWPYMNQEDLSGPRALLVLLNARGHHHPCHFASADAEAMHMGLVSTAVVPAFLNTHTMMLSGVESNQYGQLVNWDTDPDAFMLAHTQQQFLPGEGLLILEVQDRLLRFLVDCCKVLFHDIPASQLLSDIYPPQPTPELQPPPETDALDSQALMREEEPYRLPANLDLQRIQSVLQAQADAAADHFWLLREDPAYFAEEILDLRSHRQELMKDTRGGTHPILSLQHQHEFWRRITLNFLGETYTYVEAFTELARQARIVKELHDKYAPFSPADDLPKDLLFAILLFRHHLTEIAKELRGKLAFDLPGSPPWCGKFLRQPPIAGNLAKIQVTSVPRSMDNEESYLTFLLTSLWDEQQLFFLRLPLLMDEIDRHLQGSKHLLSARVGGFIGSLSIVAQCLGQLDQFYPWARSYEDKLADHESAIITRYEQWYAPLEKLRAGISSGSGQLASLVADPKTRFEYPSHQRRTRETVETLRASEQNLDDFWSATDSTLLRACRNFDGMAFPSILQRDMQRTGLWVEPASAKAKGTDVSILHKPLSALLLSATIAPSSPAVSKKKVKTRGIAQPRQAAEEEADVQAQEAGTPPVQIGVDARSLKTFRSLFFNPSASAQPGEIPWKDFRHAMATAGFEPHKLYGSAWQFQGFDKTLLFHEPHPQPKIPIWNARRIGRRLSRSLGWDIDTFVLKDKVAGK